MTKKMVIGVLLIVLATATLFAGGKSEAKNADNEITKITVDKADILAKIDSLEKQSYTGPVSVANRRFPELTVDNTVYRLMVFPMFQLFNLQIKEGDIVTVEGAKVTKELIAQLPVMPGIMFGRMAFNSENQASPFTDGNYLLVTRFTANGQTYDLKEAVNQDEFRYGRGMMPGRGKGMRGARGFCW